MTRGERGARRDGSSRSSPPDNATARGSTDSRAPSPPTRSPAEATNAGVGNRTTMDVVDEIIGGVPCLVVTQRDAVADGATIVFRPRGGVHLDAREPHTFAVAGPALVAGRGVMSMRERRLSPGARRPVTRRRSTNLAAGLPARLLADGNPPTRIRLRRRLGPGRRPSSSPASFALARRPGRRSRPAGVRRVAVDRSRGGHRARRPDPSPTTRSSGGTALRMMADVYLAGRRSPVRPPRRPPLTPTLRAFPGRCSCRSATLRVTPRRTRRPSSVPVHRIAGVDVTLHEFPSTVVHKCGFVIRARDPRVQGPRFRPKAGTSSVRAHLT